MAAGNLSAGCWLGWVAGRAAAFLVAGCGIDPVTSLLDPSIGGLSSDGKLNEVWFEPGNNVFAVAAEPVDEPSGVIPGSARAGAGFAARFAGADTASGSAAAIPLSTVAGTVAGASATLLPGLPKLK